MPTSNLFMVYWDARDVPAAVHFTEVDVCNISKVLQRATPDVAKEVHDCYATKMGSCSVSANHECHFVYAGY